MPRPTDIAATATWAIDNTAEITGFPRQTQDPAQEGESFALPDRYEDLGHLAKGGMSVLRRVRDTVLGAELAMKILAWRFIGDERNRALFLAEARATAQLQHPGIVAVQDCGELADGRLWFTMSIVRGDTLDELADEATGMRTGGPGRWSRRRVIGVLQQVCDIVAYAHSEGAVHRDLKPTNVMVGRFSEVRVMDWGLATMPGIEHPFPLRGVVVGTPAYMAPEQARGLACTPAADVYALGGILYRVLTGRHPRQGTVPQVVRMAARGQAPSLPPAADLPEPLRELALAAMSRQPSLRPSARAMSQSLAEWLDGAQRRREALEHVEQARHERPAIDALHERARLLRARATDILDRVRPEDPIEAKKPAWNLQDKAAAVLSEATLREVRWTQRLRAALNRAPDLDEAHEVLADHYLQALKTAEAERDELAIARYEALLTDHDRGAHAAYLRGDGAITLHTSRPVRVRAHRFVESDRRLEPVFERELGTTPLTEVKLGKGSWLLTLHAEDGVVVNYPVLIGRGEHWHGCAPGASEPTPVWIPRPGEITPHEAYVPAGYAIIGGDADAVDPLPRQSVWFDGFIVQRFPVTLGAWREWLQGLLDAGDEDAVQACWPWRRDRDQFLRVRDGRITCTDDSTVQHPVVAITHVAACRYASAHGGRLLTSIEYEKAGRGVDGRLTPWGDTLEARWSRVAGSPPLRGSTLPIDSFPTDVSVYGLRGVAGNTRTWCADPWTRLGPIRDGRAVVTTEGELPVLKGAVFSGPATLQRLATRMADPREHRQDQLGLRWMRPLPLTPE